MRASSPQALSLFLSRARISTANSAELTLASCPRPRHRHLKLRNPTVAAEIYTRLLQNPSVPQREREVALRKLALCETMLGDSHGGGAASGEKAA